MADNIKDKYTRKQFADEVREQHPGFKEFSDDDIVNAYISRHPELKDVIVGQGTLTGQEIKAPATGLDRVKELFNTYRDRAGRYTLENLPNEMAALFGVAGMGAGPEVGIPMTALGGGAGKAAQRLVGMAGGDRPTSGDVAKDIAMEAGKQGLYELGGQGISRIGKAIFPTPRSAYIAFGTKSGELMPKINKILPDIDKVAYAKGVAPEAMPIGKFFDIAKQTGLNLENEFSQAIFPISNIHLNTSHIAHSVMNEITPNMAKTEIGQAEAQYLKDRADEYASKAWTIGELNAERETVSKRLRAFYDKSGSAQAHDIKTIAQVRADKAIESALKDTVYDFAEQSGSKPAGYFTTLKQKESALIDLRDAAEKANSNLTKYAFESKGAPISEKLRLHIHAYPKLHGVPGSVGGYSPRFGGSNELAHATNQLSKAFPGKASSAARYVREMVGSTARKGAEREAETGLPYKAVTTARQREIQRQINSMPLRMLFSLQSEGNDASQTQQ